MNHRPVISLAILAIGLAFTTSLRAAHRYEELEGSLVLVDTTAGSGILAVTTSQTINFSVDAKTRIRLGDKAVPFSTLQAGMDVTLRLATATGVAEWIHAPEHVVEKGKILVADPANNLAVLWLPDGSTYGFTIDTTTQFSIGDQAATLTQLNVGMEVEVRVLQLTGVAERIHGPRFLEEKGTLAVVDTTLDLVSLTLADGTSLEFDVDAKTRIYIRGKHHPLSDLKIGSTARVRLDQRRWIAEWIDER